MLRYYTLLRADADTLRDATIRHALFRYAMPMIAPRHAAILIHTIRYHNIYMSLPAHLHRVVVLHVTPIQDAHRQSYTQQRSALAIDAATRRYATLILRTYMLS